jgi:hypothetical protein
MKQLIMSFAVVFITGMFSCNKRESLIPYIIQVTAIVDITDPLALYPDADAILRLYGLDKDKDREAFFRLYLITDKQLNQMESFHLPDGFTTEANNRFDDPQYRQKTILLFYQTLHKALSDFTAIHNRDSSLKHSECFKTIAEQLINMKRKHADENTLLVFSDIRENSDLFSSYKKKGQDSLFSSPEKIISIFEKTKLLPDDLKGFNIFFVYEPKSREDDKIYVSMVSIYRVMLEKRGARVNVQASSKNYTYE